MCIGQAHRHHHMTGPDSKGFIKYLGDMQLLQGHLTAFFKFVLIFGIFSILHFYARSRTAIFELYLRS